MSTNQNVNQESTTDTKREAEEQYAKAKELASKALSEAKDTVTSGVSAAASYAVAKSVDVKEKAAGAAKATVEYISEKRKGVKNESIDEIEVVDDDDVEEEEPEVVTVVHPPVSIRVLLEAVGEVVIGIVNTTIDLVIGNQTPVDREE